MAIRRSHQSASSSPPARHQPSIAAIVGFDGVSRVKPIGPSGMVDVEVDRLQVGARAEGLAAGAGEDQDPGALVGLEVAQALAQGLRGRGVDRVAPLGPVDGQDRGGAHPLVANLSLLIRGSFHRQAELEGGSGRASRGAAHGVRRRRPAPRACAPVARPGGQVSQRPPATVGGRGRRQRKSDR